MVQCDNEVLAVASYRAFHKADDSWTHSSIYRFESESNFFAIDRDLTDYWHREFLSHDTRIDPLEPNAADEKNDRLSVLLVATACQLPPPGE